MKFSCNKCDTKYSIADEKVRGKVLKIRCKKCENIIVLREPQPAAQPAPEPEPEPPEQPEQGEGDQATRAVALDPEMLAALRNGGPAPKKLNVGTNAKPAAAQAREPDDGGFGAAPESTRVVQSQEIQALLKQGAPAPAAGGRTATAAAPKAQPAPPPQPDIEWFLAIQGQQVGPLNQAEVEEKISSRQADERTYGWCDGMGDWKRLADIPSFKGALVARRAPPPPAPEPERDPDATQAVNGDNVVDLRAEIAKRTRKAEGAASLAQGAAPPVEPDQGADIPPPAADNGPLDLFGDAPVSSASGMAPPSDEDLAAMMDEAASHTMIGAAPLLASGNPEDPFASVPNAASADGPPRESTKMFIAAAGLANRSTKHRLYAGLASLFVVGLGGVLYLDYAGIYQIPIAHDIIDYSIALTGGELPPERERIVVDEDEGIIGRLFPKPKADPSRKKPKVIKPGSPDGEDSLDALKRGLEGAKEGPAGLVVERKDGEAIKGPDLKTDAVASDAIRRQLDQGGKRPTVDLGEKSTVAAPTAAASGPKQEHTPLTQEQIGKVVADQKVSLTDCGNRAAQQGESWKGTARVTVTIGPSGKVLRAVVNDELLGRTKLGDCLAHAVLRWMFPRFDGDPFDAEIPLKLSVGK